MLIFFYFVSFFVVWIFSRQGPLYFCHGDQTQFFCVVAVLGPGCICFLSLVSIFAFQCIKGKREWRDILMFVLMMVFFIDFIFLLNVRV